ncbi:MAG TPA: 2'-deoxycytidine 5'-triphosphate deaminase [Alphaproteobacteria bacterium]|nr:2'-deoxycytidine 5'-triphosphate deaminase [Alphaproteobacteria bacterium]
MGLTKRSKMGAAMTPEADTLFPDATVKKMNTPTNQGLGLLPYQALKALVADGVVNAANGILDEQIQPASIDLRLDRFAHRIRASFLPGEQRTVHDKIAQYGTHDIDLTNGAVLERGCAYIVPLMEHVKLPGRVAGVANPKSSVGRLDIFTRLITDHGTEFDRVAAGYHGRLYAEISPRTFSIVVHQGSRLNQLRLRRGTQSSSAAEILALHEKEGLVDRDLSRVALSEGVPLTVDLVGENRDGLVGFRAKKHTGLIDLDRVGQYDPVDYWEPIYATKDTSLILDPGEFYILASKEAVNIPPTHAAEMVAYDTFVGEFRVHYAGFFDPGFGHADERAEGTRAVLEVRSHDVPFMIEDGQLVGRLVFERLTDRPSRLYGAGIGSSYQRQGLQLSKQFKPFA